MKKYPPHDAPAEAVTELSNVQASIQPLQPPSMPSITQRHSSAKLKEMGDAIKEKMNKEDFNDQQ